MWESGENPERPRHCNRDETVQVTAFWVGRRRSRTNESQDTFINAMDVMRGRNDPSSCHGTYEAFYTRGTASAVPLVFGCAEGDGLLVEEYLFGWLRF